LLFSQRNELILKIQHLSSVLSQEKEMRDTWITRLENEQRQHGKIMAEFVRVKNQLKDKTSQIHQLNNKVDDLNESWK